MMRHLDTTLPRALGLFALALGLAAAATRGQAPAPPPPQPAPKVWRFQTRAGGDAAGPNYVFVGGRRPMQIATLGKERGFLGVQLVDLTTDLRAYFGASPDAGVLVSSVEEGSPAAEAGLEAGDVVISIDGESVDSSFALARRVGTSEKGTELMLEVIRDRTTRRVTAVVAERERPQVDVGFMFRSCVEGEEDCDEVVAPPGTAWDLLAPGPVRELTLEPDRFSEAIQELEARLESPEWRAKVTTFQDRIGQLEERIRELERRLESRENN
jgi:hypothetical protein